MEPGTVLVVVAGSGHNSSLWVIVRLWRGRWRWWQRCISELSCNVWDWIQLGVFSTLQHTVVNDGVLIVQGEQGEVFVSSDPQDASIIAGFKLNMMNMRDAAAGTVRPLLMRVHFSIHNLQSNFKGAQGWVWVSWPLVQVLWESPPEWTSKFFQEELEAHVPRVINLNLSHDDSLDHESPIPNPLNPLSTPWKPFPSISNHGTFTLNLELAAIHLLSRPCFLLFYFLLDITMASPSLSIAAISIMDL
jgi:hypothetical protein